LTNPWLEVDKKIVSEIYTSSEPMDNLKMLCDVYGSRFPGTPGDFASVKYMVEKLKEYHKEKYGEDYGARIEVLPKEVEDDYKKSKS
jgi:hypothetical protein